MLKKRVNRDLSQDAGIFIRLLFNVPPDVFISASLRKLPGDVKTDQVTEVTAMKRSGFPDITIVHVRLGLLVVWIQRLLPSERQTQIFMAISRVQIGKYPIEAFGLAFEKAEATVHKG